MFILAYVIKLFLIGHFKIARGYTRMASEIVTYLDSTVQ